MSLISSDNRAISSVNLLLNDIGIDQAENLVGILKEHPTLKSLCGNTGNETELDMSGKMGGAADAIMLVPEIVDNMVMTSLNLSDNNLGELVLPEGWAYRFYEYTHTDGRVQEENPGKSDGIIAITNSIPDMGALIKLDIRSNRIGAEQEGDLQRICAASGIDLAK
jgi:hypothetical protein